MINWEKYSLDEAMIVIDDIVGIALQFNTNKHPLGELDLPVGGGFVYSLFITWKRADAICDITNRMTLFPIMRKVINDESIDVKLKEWYPEMLQKYSVKFLKEKHVEQW